MDIKLLITDLDGTITTRESDIPKSVSDRLNQLGSAGVVRAVATGRTLHSALLVLPTDFPIDYLIFSSGAGIVRWSDVTNMVATHHLEYDDIMRAIQHLLAGGLDFMVHKQIPDNHHFYYFTSGRLNPDFAKRCERNADYAIPARLSFPVLRQATQLLVVEPPQSGPALYTRLKQDLSPLSVIRTTSPQDNASTWIEVFAPGVCKAKGAAWLADHLQFTSENVLAVGNDYNDSDLLAWAGKSWLVGDAPLDMHANFSVASLPGPEGFLEACRQIIR